jgi:hypothetical protein
MLEMRRFELASVEYVERFGSSTSTSVVFGGRPVAMTAPPFAVSLALKSFVLSTISA